MADSQWLVYAVVAMVLFSLGNLVLKIAVDSVDFSKVRLDLSAPLLLVLAAAVVVLYAAYGQLGLQAEVLKYAAVFIVLALLGFLALVQALRAGPVGLVNSVLALSIVLVAILSYFLLGEKFTARQAFAVALATVSVIILSS